MKLIAVCFLIVFSIWIPATATIINVPQQYSAIQDAIDASSNGDTIQVSPGTYSGRVNYLGKLVLLTSIAGPESTIITTVPDSLPLIRFYWGEDSTAVLRGFTIRGGTGIAIGCLYSGPIVENNIIENNTNHGHYSQNFDAAAIYASQAYITIRNNIIRQNSSPGAGGAIAIKSSTGVTITGNQIISNSAGTGGGGIFMILCDNCLVEKNLIVGNTAIIGGGGIWITEGQHNQIINNTIVSNSGGTSSGTYGSGFVLLNTDYNVVKDNIITDNSPNYGIKKTWGIPFSDSLTYNDIYGNTPADIDSVILGIGSISEAPLFLDTLNGNYHLDLISPCVDTGDPSSALDPDGTRADMGAFYVDHSNLTFTITASSELNGSISPSGTLSINYGADTTFTITANTGYHIADVLVDGISVGAVASYQFINVTANHTIAASFAINVFTITASAGGNGSITPSGAIFVNYGADTTFTITANTGYHIADVLVDGVSVGAVASYQFTNVTANHTIAASFTINIFTITASAGAHGIISPSGTIPINFGADTTFTITANTGYHIADVLVDGVSVGAVGSYQFTNITANHTIAASFAINVFTITASAGAHGTISPSGAIPINFGADTTFTITANTGYHIADVLVDGISVGAVASYQFINVTANHTIAASFAINVFTITASAGGNGSITPSGAIFVNYGADTTFTITANTGYHIADVLVDGVSVGAVASYQFTNVTANHTIAASFAINVFTITTSAGGNGSITPSGTIPINFGADTTFIITPDSGYNIANVLVDGVSVGAVGSYQFTNVTANHTIAASFAIDVFTITASAGAHGTISPSGTIPINFGADTTFIITPDSGYHIADVLVDGVSAGAVGSYQFTNVTANHTIAASFAIDVFTITASAGAHGTISPSGTIPINFGADTTFIITPDSGYNIANVLVDGVSAGAVGSYQFTNVTANHTIAASFAINVFTITASAGGNGSITPSGTIPVNFGADTTFIITPDSGYNIADVLVDGVSVGAVASYQFTNVTANHTIAASFAINVFTITASAGGNGSITPSGTIPVNFGADTTFIITPDSGYNIADVLVDGVSVGAVASYQFTNVTANHTIAASFAINVFNITASAGGNGSITPSGAIFVNYGADTTFTITANTGYHIADVLVDGVSVGAVGSYQFTNVTANHTIAASFAINVFTITASSGAYGIISPSGTIPINFGADTTFTITANTGYHIADVLVDGVSVGAVTSYQFTNVTANHTIAASFAINVFTITASAGGNGSITPSGAIFVNYGADTTFTITANTGYHIADVLVDGVSVGAVASYQFTNVIANHTIAASFAINVFTITASAGGNGSIIPSGTIPINFGADTTFIITPDSGYNIANVLVDGVSVGAVTSYQFTNVTANHTVAASFAIDVFTITASAGAHGTISPSGTIPINFGADTTFTITANTGYHIADVLVDGVSVGAVGSYQFTNVTANHTIAASFAINVFTITASAGAHGTISPSGTIPINFGADTTFIITPDSGYHIADVLVDGVSVGAVASYQFTNVTANHTIAASFAINEFTITASAGGNGSITPSGTIPINFGADTTFTITANTGYHIADVLVDGVSVGAVTSYQFTNVTANHTIAASFAIDVFTITASVGAHGIISPSGTIPINFGADTTFIITPDSGYNIANVLVDGVSAGAVGSYQFTNVTANHTIAASFAINVFTITASAGAHGIISPSGTIPINFGADTTFIITPDSGYHIADVLVDGVSAGAVGSYQFTNVTANHTIAASFAIDVFTITASAGAHGIISPSGTIPINFGADTTFIITPDSGYNIADVLVDGVSVGAVASYQFTNVTANHTIAASFTINVFTITASAGAHGTISPSGTIPINFGADTTFIITPDSGYHIADVLVDGVSIGPDSSYIFSNVSANHTIAASFTINVFTITASAGAHGTISPLGTIPINFGADTTFIITPDSGYNIADVLVDGVSVGAVASYQFTNVSANHTISVDFARCFYTAGDINNSGVTNGIDVTYGVLYFKGGPPPPYSCDCDGSNWYVAGDVNGTCVFNGIDISYMVAYFKGGLAPIPCPSCPPAMLEAP